MSEGRAVGAEAVARTVVKAAVALEALQRAKEASCGDLRCTLPVLPYGKASPPTPPTSLRRVWSAPRILPQANGTVSTSISLHPRTGSPP